MPSSPECSAIILAGGESRRFGTDKAAVRWRDRRLVEHVVAALRPISAEVVLVAREVSPADGWPADRVLLDRPDDPPGPLRGLVRGLEACGTALAWVVACDAPLPQAALLEALRREVAPGVAAVVPVWEGRLQPLMACYATTAAAELAAALAAGQQAPIGALERISYATFPQERCREYDPGGLSFVNVNTPGDLARLDVLIDRLDSGR